MKLFNSKYVLFLSLLSFFGIVSTPNAIHRFRVDQPQSITAFINYYYQKGLVLRDSVSGNLNKDSLVDYVLLFDKKVSTPQIPVDLIEPRPIVILCGAGNGLFKHILINWNIALCKTCGDTLSDPYLRTVIKRGYFSIEQSGSQKIQWQRITTFKFIDSLKTWVLHQDGVVSKIIAPDSVFHSSYSGYKVLKTPKDFGFIPIDSFNIYTFDKHLSNIDSSVLFPVPNRKYAIFQPWNIVRSGLWDVLNICTNTISKGYLYFVKCDGDSLESPNESDLGVLYHLNSNLPIPDSCGGFAFRNIASIKPGKINCAVYDSILNIYYCNKDTVSFRLNSSSTDSMIQNIVFIRCQDTLNIDSSTIYKDERFGVSYAGDLNSDGFIDFIFYNNSTHSSDNLLYLSKKINNKVKMVYAGGKSFTG